MNNKRDQIFQILMNTQTFDYLQKLRDYQLLLF